MSDTEDRRFPTDDPAVVTCGLPYANGGIHVGHLRSFVGGDVFSRALEKVGQETAFVCGSDMHGTPIAVQAEREGRDPEELALRWHEEFTEQFPEFDVDFDNYGHTHDGTNTELTREFVRRWIDGDHVIEREIQVAWDPEVDQPLPDRFVEGTCPYCGETARGDECDEGCQRHLEPGEIVDPVSTITGNPAEYRSRTHEFLKLSDFQAYLQGFIDRLEGTDNARNQPREWIEGELEDLCITRDMDWGIDYPDGEDGEQDLVLYVWVDAPIEYVASTKQYSERVGTEEFDWREVWGGDGRDPERSDIVHVIGKDIIQHHTVFWPAMLRAAEYDEPRAVMACGWVTIDGKGLSTSRNRAVWAEEYLEEGFDADFLRYYLATAGGFQGDVDFAWDRFRERVNDELVGVVGNFIYRSLLFANRNFGGTPGADLSPEVEERIEDAIGEFRDGVDDYSVRDVGEAAVRLARFGNEYIQRNEPWKLDDEEAAPVIRDCVQVAKAVTVLAQPVIPSTAEEVWSTLGEPGSVDEVRLAAALEAPPAEFGEPTEPFEKVDPEHTEELAERLEERVAAASEADGAGADDEAEADADADGEAGEAEAAGDGDGADAGELEPLADDRISFEEFQDLDIRVGRIETVDPIEGADDLVKLTVDVGVETRQVVAGIKQLHDLNELPGKKVVLLANLEKAELFGVESNGMVLAAGEEADLLTTHGDAVPGEKIR
ncbi:methionine--tRNA ligase [Halobacteriales archaeon QS_8_69_26]|nr:MAG: methionine--tRNA ligase [Halobacteriales archaeon QS_8_69_26]